MGYLSGLDFLGLPTGLRSLICSNASIGYRASLLMGLKSALCNNFFIAFLLFLRRSAISSTVKNSFPFISINSIIDIFPKKNTPSAYILNICIVFWKKHLKKGPISAFYTCKRHY